ncbi:MAG: sigma-E processing peptidase SpoIIGA [Eubacteriales bacterium]|nr:sigma-E processing peptidase SpoIIGA [Eubacteriales bacterium]
MDVFFGINFVMDLLMLMLVNYVMKFAATNWRLLFSATFGACWSVAVLMIPETYKLFVNICTYVLAAPVMVRICAGNNIKCVLKGTVVLMAIAVFMGGLMHFLYYNTYAGYFVRCVLLRDNVLMVFILFSLILTFLLIRWLLWGKRLHSVLRNVRCVIDNESVEFEAIIDTGNCLTDPVTGKPVTVVEKNVMRGILNNIDDYTKVKYHLVPFRTVGCDDGMIEVITIDIMYIYDEKSTVSLHNVLVGLSENRLSSQGMYQALINPQLIEGKYS